MINPSQAASARLFTTWNTVLYVDTESGEPRDGVIDTVAPIDGNKCKTLAAENLRYYRDNPAAVVDACRKIQEAPRQILAIHNRRVDRLIETGRSHWECSARAANGVGA